NVSPAKAAAVQVRRLNPAHRGEPLPRVRQAAAPIIWHYKNSLPDAGLTLICFWIENPFSNRYYKNYIGKVARD
ncbi:MAG: hypothetical protein ACOC8Q_02740, partial [Desulfosalsimonas sp.]